LYLQYPSSLAPEREKTDEKEYGTIRKEDLLNEGRRGRDERNYLHRVVEGLGIEH
jgi:hypothetical protein